MSNTDLSNRVVIITGAAGDLGLAMAGCFAAAGGRLALLDSNGARLDSHGIAGALSLTCDVSSAADAAAAVQRVATHYGAIHALVNNAAVVTPKNPVADLPPADWQRAFAVNVTGAFLMAQAVIPHMRRAGGGVVLNIASQLGHVTAPGQAAYSASKAALLSLTRSIAVDHAADGIRALSLSPGALATGRLAARYGSIEAARAELAGRYPVGRIGEAAEIACIALFMLGEDAGFATGSDWVADGAYTAV